MNDQDSTPKQISKRRDDAIRRALNTPPVQNKDLKGATKKKPKKGDKRPTPSSEKRA